MNHKKATFARRRLRIILRSVLSLHGSPEAIALGIAIGSIVAFLPVIGFQLILAVLLSTLFNANRLAAVIPPWITNPATIIPVFTFTHRLGTMFWRKHVPNTNVLGFLKNAAQNLRDFDLPGLQARFHESLELGADVFVPMFIGGLIVGGLCAAVAYPVSLQMVREYRKQRHIHRARRTRSLHEKMNINQ